MKGRNGSERKLHSLIRLSNLGIMVGRKKRGGVIMTRNMLGRWHAEGGAQGCWCLLNHSQLAPHPCTCPTCPSCQGQPTIFQYANASPVYPVQLHTRIRHISAPPHAAGLAFYSTLGCSGTTSSLPKPPSHRIIHAKPHFFSDCALPK